MNKKDKNIKQRTIKISLETHTALSIYKAQNGLRTLGEAVQKLLDNASHTLKENK